jgi:hypothetical protein
MCVLLSTSVRNKCVEHVLHIYTEHILINVLINVCIYICIYCVCVCRELHICTEHILYIYESSDIQGLRPRVLSIVSLNTNNKLVLLPRRERVYYWY